MNNDTIVEQVRGIIEPHVLSNNPAEVSGIIGIVGSDSHIVHQTVGTIEGVYYAEIDDMIGMYLSGYDRFVMYHSHPPSNGQDGASPADTLCYSQIDKAFALLAHFSQINELFLKTEYLKETYSNVATHAQISKIREQPGKIVSISHLIAYQNPHINFLVFNSLPRSCADLQYTDNGVNRFRNKWGEKISFMALPILDDTEKSLSYYSF